MTQEQRDEIRARCEAATPGKWAWDGEVGKDADEETA